MKTQKNTGTKKMNEHKAQKKIEQILTDLWTTKFLEASEEYQEAYPDLGNGDFLWAILERKQEEFDMFKKKMSEYRC
ncbi:hypothetical protein [Kurthia sibirica]|uniref:hypothetical protein n=1 Tax=Kurthia sibirica TaxID=202750 RepID=UPI001167F7B1|nr:hypothetical protein [Kurthia sibirica]GEK35437.1 hypothetical protein KSI01_29700 [Kurthia sibirica]